MGCGDTSFSGISWEGNAGEGRGNGEEDLPLGEEDLSWLWPAAWARNRGEPVTLSGTQSPLPCSLSLPPHH